MQFVHSRGPRSTLSVVLSFLLLTTPTVVFAQATDVPPPAPQGNGAQLSDEQIDQMMAPIALYPDALLSQVLMASTYPDQVLQAATWSAAHPDLKGDAAVKAVANQPWDPSVQSLVAFPQALATLNEKPDWLRRVGAAFLAEPSAVMDSVQRLRTMAQDNGSLTSNAQQIVQTEPAPVTEGAAAAPIIVIEPAQPDVVYVPSYNPEYVYGAWPYPAYPPYYVPPPFGYGIAAGVASGLAFGFGVAATSALWGGFGWGRGDVNINVNRYNNLNANHRLGASQNSWTRNNQARIDNARSRTHYQQTLNRNGTRAQPGNRAQGAQRQTRANPQRPQQARRANPQRGQQAQRANRPQQAQRGQQRANPQRAQQTQRAQQQRPQQRPQQAQRSQQRPQQAQRSQQRPQRSQPRAQSRPSGGSRGGGQARRGGGGRRR